MLGSFSTTDISKYFYFFSGLHDFCRDYQTGTEVVNQLSGTALMQYVWSSGFHLHQHRNTPEKIIRPIFIDVLCAFYVVCMCVWGGVCVIMYSHTFTRMSKSILGILGRTDNWCLQSFLKGKKHRKFSFVQVSCLFQVKKKCSQRKMNLILVARVISSGIPLKHHDGTTCS